MNDIDSIKIYNLKLARVSQQIKVVTPWDCSPGLIILMGHVSSNLIVYNVYYLKLNSGSIHIF